MRDRVWSALFAVAVIGAALGTYGDAILRFFDFFWFCGIGNFPSRV